LVEWTLVERTLVESTSRWTLVERNLVESYFEANRTLVERTLVERTLVEYTVHVSECVQADLRTNLRSILSAWIRVFSYDHFYHIANAMQCLFPLTPASKKLLDATGRCRHQIAEEEFISKLFW
jgi:hypothetical protein